MSAELEEQPSAEGLTDTETSALGFRQQSDSGASSGAISSENELQQARDLLENRNAELTTAKSTIKSQEAVICSLQSELSVVLDLMEVTHDEVLNLQSQLELLQSLVHEEEQHIHSRDIELHSLKTEVKSYKREAQESEAALQSAREEMSSFQDQYGDERPTHVFWYLRNRGLALKDYPSEDQNQNRMGDNLEETRRGQLGSELDQQEKLVPVGEPRSLDELNPVELSSSMEGGKELSTALHSDLEEDPLGPLHTPDNSESYRNQYSKHKRSLHSPLQRRQWQKDFVPASPETISRLRAQLKCKEKELSALTLKKDQEVALVKQHWKAEVNKLERKVAELEERRRREVTALQEQNAALKNGEGIGSSDSERPSEEDIFSANERTPLVLEAANLDTQSKPSLPSSVSGSETIHDCCPKCLQCNIL